MSALSRSGLHKLRASEVLRIMSSWLFVYFLVCFLGVDHHVLNGLHIHGEHTRVAECVWFKFRFTMPHLCLRANLIPLFFISVIRIAKVHLMLVLTQQESLLLHPPQRLFSHFLNKHRVSPKVFLPVLKCFLPPSLTCLTRMSRTSGPWGRNLGLRQQGRLVLKRKLLVMMLERGQLTIFTLKIASILCILGLCKVLQRNRLR